MTKKKLIDNGWFSIGEIGNYYGGLSAKKDSTTGKCVWGIENYDGIFEEEIPEYLLEALAKYESERLRSKKQD